VVGVSAVRYRPEPGPERAFRELWEDIRDVLVRPTRAFYRIVEGGRIIAPVVAAGLVGLVGSGSQTLKVAILAAIGGGWSSLWLAKFVLAFLLLFPLGYAAWVAATAAAGRVVAGKGLGLGFRQLFRRCWSALGWVYLPLLVTTVIVLVWVSVFSGPGLREAFRLGDDSLTPSFFFPVALPLGLAISLWVVVLLVIAVRQALATDTVRAMVVIAVTCLAGAVLVHTPVARSIATGFVDSEGLLGRGRASVVISLVAYTWPRERAPERGDLVALRDPVRGSADVFVLDTPFGVITHGYKGVPMARVIGLPGDRVAVDAGVVLLNGEVLDEPYLRDVPSHMAHPMLLDVDEVTVPEGHVFVLPDDRSKALAGTAPHHVTPLGHVLGRVVSLQVSPGTVVMELGGLQNQGGQEVTGGVVKVDPLAGEAEPGMLPASWQAVARTPWGEVEELDTWETPFPWLAADPRSGLVLIAERPRASLSAAVVVRPSGVAKRLSKLVTEPLAFSAEGDGFAVMSPSTEGVSGSWPATTTCCWKAKPGSRPTSTTSWPRLV